MTAASCWGPGPRVDSRRRTISRRLFRTGPSGAPALLFNSTVANAAASLVGLEFKLRGPNATVSHKEASGLAAIVSRDRADSRWRASRCRGRRRRCGLRVFYKAHDRFRVMSPATAPRRARRAVRRRTRRVRPGRRRVRVVARARKRVEVARRCRTRRCSRRRRGERRRAAQRVARSIRAARADDAAGSRGRGHRSQAMSTSCMPRRMPPLRSTRSRPRRSACCSDRRPRSSRR